MSGVAERATDLFNNHGFNCAEATLTALAEAMGMEGGCIPRIATGFGAGFARKGEVCGAVSGAVMAIGLKYGRTDLGDKDARERVYPPVTELLRAFEREFGTTICRDLTGCDMTTPEGRQDFMDRRLHTEVCARLVSFAVEEVSRMLTMEEEGI